MSGPACDMANVKAYRFRIPLRSRLQLQGELHHRREGILLERDGCWSEASPLPGFSPESLEDVLAALRGEQAPPASLRFALDALATPWTTPLEVPFNRLLAGTPKEILDTLDRQVENQCRAVKLKVGRTDIEHEMRLVRQVRERLPTGVSLRLDANRAWSFDQATEFAASLPELSIEYIEEPLHDPFRLEELHLNTNLPYALDETLATEMELDAWPNVTALICKPTILGGRSAAQRLAREGKPVVFSAAFESGVGIARIIQLAQEYSPHSPAGLDTIDWLSSDLLEHALMKHAGRIRVTHAPQPTLSDLEPIHL